MAITSAKKYLGTVGRRKCSSAVVKLFPKGTGNIMVKKGDTLVSLKDYFWWHGYMIEDVLYPLSVLGPKAAKEFDAEISVKGGGLMGQAEAIRLGIARWLVEMNEDNRKLLKPYGLLKRDPRVKERKKPGLKKARKSPQWSKR
jgi:small subunit ribosomal protein S9